MPAPDGPHEVGHDRQHAPMHMPPNAAAVGMYRFSTWLQRRLAVAHHDHLAARVSCFATSRAEAPETSIHVLENRAHAAEHEGQVEHGVEAGSPR